jgi:hypothetical protein
VYSTWSKDVRGAYQVLPGGAVSRAGSTCANRSVLLAPTCLNSRLIMRDAAPILRLSGGDGNHARLQLHGTVQRIDGAGELYQHSVSHDLNDSASVMSN